MLHERISMWCVTAGAGLLALTLNGCSFNGDTVTETSDEEKARTNLDLGVRYMELGRMESALEKLKYSLELDSGNSKTHDAIAVLYERIGKDAEAAEHFEKALRLMPDNASALSNYGSFLCDKGQFAQGMAHLKTANEMPLNSRKWYALTNAGLCELQQGNDEQAEQYLRGALQQQSSYTPALLGMIKISYKQGEYFKTRAFLDRYTGATAHTAETLWYAVQTERQLGNNQQAEDYRQLLLQKFPLSEEAKKLKNVYIKS